LRPLTPIQTDVLPQASWGASLRNQLRDRRSSDLDLSLIAAAPLIIRPDWEMTRMYGPAVRRKGLSRW
jgi:hypothetical protein